mmetsp:Transcript_21892/g.46025  ORF Transcript_21892/g.46025 Transcript_21892/m.46025 type:complete len:110 (-) Transcript_21892:91-420(-)
MAMGRGHAVDAVEAGVAVHDVAAESAINTITVGIAVDAAATRSALTTVATSTPYDGERGQRSCRALTTVETRSAIEDNTTGSTVNAVSIGSALAASTSSPLGASTTPPP